MVFTYSGKGPLMETHMWYRFQAVPGFSIVNTGTVAYITITVSMVGKQPL